MSDSATTVGGCQIAPSRSRPLSYAVEGIPGWPPPAFFVNGFAVGQELPELSRPIHALPDLRIHGQPVPLQVSVRYRNRERESWGKVLVFDVTMGGGVPVGEKLCRRWWSGVEMAGVLVARASDGAFVALRLSGSSVDYEALCPQVARDWGRSTEPRTCNLGQVTLDAHWTCLDYPPGKTSPD